MLLFMYLHREQHSHLIFSFLTPHTTSSYTIATIHEHTPPFTSLLISLNILCHSLFSFWVILSDFSDIVNLFYYDLTIFSAAAVWSCPEGFLLHRGFHRNLLCNKKSILISKNAWIFILNLYIKDIPSKQHTRIFLHLLHFSLLWLKPRPISNSQLHTLPYFHLCPIYLVVFKGSY